MILFFCFVFAILGILCGSYSLWFALLLIPLLTYLTFYKRCQKKCLIIFLLFFFLFTALTLFYPKGGDYTGLGIVLKSRDNYYLLQTAKGRYYISQKSHGLSPLSPVFVKGKGEELSFSHYECGFDFTSYLKSQGVFQKLEVKEIKTLFSPLAFLTPLRQYLSSSLTERGKLFAFSLLFQDSLTKEESSSFLSSLGILNLFSLSGFHFSFFFSFLRKLLGKKKETFVDYFEPCFLFVFLLFSAFSYAMRRLFLLSLLKLVSHHTHFKTSYIERVSLVGLLLLFFEPYSLFSASFYYPFPLLLFFAFFPQREEKKKSGKLSFYLRLKMFYLPYQLKRDSSFSVLSFLCSFFFLGFSHLLFLLSLLLFISPYTGLLLNPLCDFLAASAQKLSVIDLVLVSGEQKIVFFLFYYLVLFFSEILYQYAFSHHSRLVKSLLFFSLCFSFVPDVFPHEEIVFVDVDQGDATLIRDRKSNVLIDTGGKKNVDLAKECLLPYFRKRKIRKLDAVILTHEDYDHTGALESLRQIFSIDHVYRRDDFLSQGNQISVGSLSFVNLNTYSYSVKVDENTLSGVYYTEIRKTKILIMGDAPKEVEKRILQDHPSLRCDIIKVGHHGSDTSSDAFFLASLNPSLAVISCGENNRYGHPSKATIKTLEQEKIPYRRTDLEGSIVIRL